MYIIEDIMRVAKWGNSLAVRLSKDLVERLGLKAGDELTVVAASQKRLTVEKDESRQKALDAIAGLNWALPEDYKFDRDEANEP
jgi:antitoxin MazE